MAYICSNCGLSVSNTANFCPECGTKIERELKCSNCGTILTENAKFCMECGTKVGTQENTHIEEVIVHNEREAPITDMCPSLVYVNETLPFSKEYDKNENGIDISETSFGVEYHLLSNLSVIEKIERRCDKYNKSAIKNGHKPLLFNKDTLVLKGLYEPRKVTDDMGTFKRMHIIACNASRCADFIRLCKLCETIMDKSKN